MVKMIITDLDDTLLKSDKSVSEYTVSVLKKCREKGIKIVFATARSKQAASWLFDVFMPDVFIGYGGGVALAGNEVITRIAIPDDISYRLIGECLQEPEILNVHASNEFAAFTNRLDTLDSEASHYKLADFTVQRNIHYLKISLIAANPAVVERIASHYPMCDMLRYSGQNLYRFANRDAVKWNAVKAVAKHYGINTNNAVAFGDDINDVEMLRECGFGVAVANAVDKAKSAANYICETNNSDGVAKWLEENVL